MSERFHQFTTTTEVHLRIDNKLNLHDSKLSNNTFFDISFNNIDHNLSFLLESEFQIN